LFKFKIRRGGGGFLIKTIQAKIKIEFISNNFGFHKNIQSYRCMMMHDAQTIKEQSILKKGIFSGRYITLEDRKRDFMFPHKHC
jgi:hypothetical protein